MLKVFALAGLLAFVSPAQGSAQSTAGFSSISLTDTLAAPSQEQQQHATRILSGVVVSQQNELVPNVRILVRSATGEREATTDAAGNFRLEVPDGALSLKIFGKNIALLSKSVGPHDSSENLRLVISFIVPPIHESVVIEAAQLDPSIERRNSTVYNATLFARDDQLFDTLAGGINAGQHEGGGKSLEIRRFGFNLDHGGVNGGLKVLVDDVQQNQGTQGHGQGYLGQLKSLTPELVEEVSILNGPFSAQYGDFSGLGVVHIRLKESLPDQLTLRLQGGSFNSLRAFAAYSPQLKKADAFIAYETARTDGPFLNALRYRRDNLTANYTRRLKAGEAFGFKLNAGRNDFFSSGQIPLDEVAAGRLDRFGFVDPFDGGRVRTGVLGTYYRRQWNSGAVFKADAFLSLSLFDLYSNFTFFLHDEVNGDEIQQHDSRLQEGANVQYLRPHKLFGRQALFIAGGNFHANQINVRLSPSVERRPIQSDPTLAESVPGATNRPATNDDARVNNLAGYAQQAIDFIHGHLHMELGLRYDYFRFSVSDKIEPQFGGIQSATRLQPKASIAYAPTDSLPATFYFNYGRGINSQDARGVVRNPNAPKIATTDFYQVGVSSQLRRFSLSADLFLIDRSNEQVYIPDDGSLEFAGPSRADGFEIKTSMQLTRALSFNGGVTRVMNAFYRGTSPRIYVGSAPHLTANAGFTLTDFRGFTASLRYRHTGNYRLDGEDASLRATGLDVLDFSMSKRLRPSLDLNLSVDNLTDKRYFETQNYFASRLRPGAPALFRIHGAPGYPIGITVGLTYRLFRKG
ncbi:MAG TPA: TonB-dependent receptor [Pyrinomonadaceae bacterium]